MIQAAHSSKGGLTPFVGCLQTLTDKKHQHGSVRCADFGGFPSVEPLRIRVASPERTSLSR